MHRQVNAIAGRLSLRATAAAVAGDSRPDHRDRAAAARRRTSPARAGGDPVASFRPSPTSSASFPSLCFALATGVGKTRLMGAFISYLHLAHGINNFFVLAPNLTIYNKLIADFTPNTPKYVFKGIAEFATEPPRDHHRRQLRVARRHAVRPAASAARSTSSTSRRSTPRCAAAGRRASSGCRSTSARATSTTWPGSPDLVLLMDESHRYRASAGVRAINELKPILGLELTATPFVETAQRPGAVQERHLRLPARARRWRTASSRNRPSSRGRISIRPACRRSELERIKLEDGVRLHERRKVELETYARETGSADRQAVRAGDRPRHDPRRRTAGADQVGRRSSTAATRTRSSRSIRAGPARKKDEMVERLLQVEQRGRADRDRHPRQHAEGRLGRHEPLHHRAAARRQRADADRADHRPRSAPALRQAHRRRRRSIGSTSSPTTGFRRSSTRRTGPIRRSSSKRWCSIRTSSASKIGHRRLAAEHRNDARHQTGPSFQHHDGGDGQSRAAFTRSSGDRRWPGSPTMRSRNCNGIPISCRTSAISQKPEVQARLVEEVRSTIQPRCNSALDGMRT